MAPTLVLALAFVAAPPSPSGGDRVLEIRLRPAGDPQIAVWLEDSQGQFVDTLMVTRLTGTFGLGNRPGQPNLGGGYRWPYGRRENVLPVWAHRRGVRYPRMVFQDCREDSLGWHERHSTVERFYCRPVTQQEQRTIDAARADGRVDAVSCPTSRFSSDKGIPMSEVDRGKPLCSALYDRYGSEESVYPPRNDVHEVISGRDWDGLDQAAEWNDLDAVSQATPPSGALHEVRWSIPEALADGEYTVWVEVNQAFDPNEHHDYAFFVDPQLPNYGVRVIGQPSVLWRVPITIGGAEARASTAEHVGYGSPTGLDGTLNPADGTITSGIDGTGAGRLLPIQDEGVSYQVGVRYGPPGSDPTCTPPPTPTGIREVATDWRGVDVMIDMPPMGPRTRLDIRYAYGHGAIRSEADFVAAVDEAAITPPADATEQSVRIALNDAADYTVAVRAVSACGEASEFVTLDVTTPQRVYASVDACFVATAAHGAAYAEEVATLRRFRDEVLLPTDAGLTAVELYYYLSPDLADAIRRRPALRAATRWALKPLVWLASGGEERN